MISFEDMVTKSNMKQDLPEDMMLIPEGPFLMGSTEEDINKLLELDRNVEASRFDVEVPQREVFMSAYLIDKYPVTNADYKKFIESGAYKQRDFWSDAGWDYVQQANLWIVTVCTAPWMVKMIVL
jgi:formylglycine-generating enzyme required for sulfatase activity